MTMFSLESFFLQKPKQIVKFKKILVERRRRKAIITKERYGLDSFQLLTCSSAFLLFFVRRRSGEEKKLSMIAGPDFCSFPQPFSSIHFLSLEAHHYQTLFTYLSLKAMVSFFTSHFLNLLFLYLINHFARCC